jgi:hypothetical protein
LQPFDRAAGVGRACQNGHDGGTYSYEPLRVANRRQPSHLEHGQCGVDGRRERQILQTVAEAWNENIDDLDIIDGQVVSCTTEESMPLRDIVIYGMQRSYGTWISGPVVGQGKFMPEYVTLLDPETGQGPRGRPLHRRLPGSRGGGG